MRSHRADGKIGSLAVCVEQRQRAPQRAACVGIHRAAPALKQGSDVSQVRTSTCERPTRAESFGTHQSLICNGPRSCEPLVLRTWAPIRWDRGERVQTIDSAEHKTWDHGYAETVYSAQSKTYARVYVSAPVNSSLVNGQNYYTAITRARLGVKLSASSSDRPRR
ncbi:hypothetical protein OY671_007898 [Metschnikowia pulcherrima]|nr:hypothetical protein OY671_007898 [Metschnikowia pulcherrima]